MIRTISSLLCILVLVGAMVSSDRVVRAEDTHGGLRFTALDGGAAVLSHVLVTAMAVQSNGTIYAGGRYLIPINDPHAAPPVLEAGSVWAVSRDHGAHWVTHVSSIGQTPPNSQLWRNHTLWPDSFTANSVVVDPTNPHIIYAAGCMSDATCAGSSGSHLLLRSSDSGRTWQDALVFGRFPRLHGNIVMTSLLQQVLRRGGTTPTQGYDVSVDPHNGKRVYACVSGLGMLRSDDGARSWRYVPQPLSLGGRCELLIDPSNAKIIYSLDRQNRVLYRTDNGGASWGIRSAFAQNNQNILVLSELTLVAHALFMTGRTGIYKSIDGGAHWTFAIGSPTAGVVGTSIRGAGGWILAFIPTSNAQPEGVYVERDGGPWQLGAATDERGLRYYGSLDLQAFGAGDSRMWEDHSDRTVFTTPQTGGLYRWSSAL